MEITVRSLVPDFYNTFKCKAGACKHTCCQKWEIDVDDDSAEYYFQQKGKLGEALRQNVVKQEDGYVLRLNEKGFCPFLQADGLCHLIVTLGEDSLCDICAAHPRFYEYFQGEADVDIELGGVGMCCEATVELLLADEAPLKFYLEQEAEPLSFDQVLEVLELEFPHGMTYIPRREQQYLEFVLAAMAQTEPIDAQWTEHIQELQERLPELVTAMKAEKLSQPQFTKLMHYVLYRQLEKSFSYSTTVIQNFVQLNMDFIFLESIATGNLQETLRRWSEQIEYDEDNVELLLQLSAENL